MEAHAHRGAKDGAGAEAVGEDVAVVVPAVLQAQLADALQLHLLAAAPLHPPCKA